MPDIKISALPASGALDGSEQIPMVKNGVTVRTSSQSVADLFNLTAPVSSVNGQTGEVILDSDDIEAGAVNLYMTEEEKTKLSGLNKNESFVMAVTDETTAITVGTNKLTFRAPYAAILTGVTASCSVAPTGAAIVIDVNKNGTTMLSTKASIAAGSKTSVGGTAAVVSVPSIAADDEITVDLDQVGSTIAGAGVKIALQWTKA